MDAPKIRSININLKQVQTVDTSKQTSKANAESFKSNNKASSESNNKSTESSKPSQSSQSNQSGQNRTKPPTTGPASNQKKSTTATNPTVKQKPDGLGNDLKQQSKSLSSSDKASPKKSVGDQSNSNQTKKLKVPFAVKPANQPKSEPKYSNENKNLRLLNQADETRKELLNIKIKKVAERSNDRPTDRSNLKSIDTSDKHSTLKASDGQPSKPVTGVGVTGTKPANSSIAPDKSKPLLPTPTAFGKAPEPKGTNRLANFYLKSVPDHFNYLEDDSDDIIDINSFRNMNKARSQQPRKPATGDNLNGLATITSQSTNQFGDSIVGQTKNGDQFDSNNFSSQFLKSQKESLEIGELISYRITNEDEKFRTRSVINHLMKVLIEYKRSTYQPNLVEELDACLEKFSSDSLS